MNRVILVFFTVTLLLSTRGYTKDEKLKINALYIPLADHYAAIIAYELYRYDMEYADFSIERVPNWDLLRAKFLNDKADMAFVMAPLAMSMYQQSQSFKWVGLMHRDGNGLAITHQLAEQLALPAERNARLPQKNLAQAVKLADQNQNKIIVGVPHILSTHSVALFKYLKDNNLTLGITPNDDADVFVRTVSPPSSPAYLLGQGNLSQVAGIEQSLPWIDVVETENYGRVAWFSKDIITSNNGHVECIALATNYALNNKKQAVDEVFLAIKKAGKYIEEAREQGGDNLNKIVKLIRKHIPAHTEKAIRQSLNPELRVINYLNLDIDKPGLQKIMNLAIEAGVLKQVIDIDEFAHIDKASDNEIEQK
ncbi:ABC transporter substrate-binding protein [Thalassotalea sp. M1531]|uniref:ABC transporter substrate-binding protein n=1 Tax=Thalassotalea algicola TaxID=2716224 RepID=A0A7Y0LBC1_9GAMM|nr:ABC transporter substrate-binding protein [Thalassotalea algicola]NMP31286.1 ABC transporter substrate-binding protein [Thalassotalea algicola]